MLFYESFQERNVFIDKKRYVLNVHSLLNHGIDHSFEHEILLLEVFILLFEVFVLLLNLRLLLFQLGFPLLQLLVFFMMAVSRSSMAEKYSSSTFMSVLTSASAAAAVSRWIRYMMSASS